MGRTKNSVRRIENPTSREATYSKRKDGIVKKANELSVLCDTDVALVMFSPNGRLTRFASDGRVEDVLLRFLRRLDEDKGGPVLNREFLSYRLKQLKNEAEMLQKIAKLEALEDVLYKLNRRQCEAQEKMRYFNPDEKKITSIFEAGMYQQFLESEIQQIEQSKVKFLLNGIEQQMEGNVEEASFVLEEEISSIKESANANKDSEDHRVEASVKGTPSIQTFSS